MFACTKKSDIMEKFSFNNKIIGIMGIVIIFIIIISIIVVMTGNQRNNENINDNNYDITTADNIPVTSDSIGFEGGSITVTDESNPLFGLNINLSQGATYDFVNFNIGYSNVTEITGLPDGASIVSKMISVETDGNEIWDEYKYFEKPCKVTFPYDPNIVTNEEAIRFYSYDEESGQFDATCFISQDTDANTITFYSGSFSNFTAIEISMTYYDYFYENVEVDVGFRPNTDGWFIDNWGSYLSSGGVCLGMTSYAQWYYAHKKTSNGNLYSKYLEGDKGEWRDDETAIELATRCQLGSSGIWSSLTQDEVDWAIVNSKDVAYSIIHGMIVSEQPQLIGLKTKYSNGTWADGGHAVLTYRYSEGRFDIYDPNFHGTTPGTDMRQIPFDYNTGFTRIYYSGQSAASSSSQYNIFYHASSKTFAPKKAYEQLFQGAEKKFEDDSIFPEVELTDSTTSLTGSTPIDTNYDGVRDTNENSCVISGTIKGGQKAITSTLLFVSGQKFKTTVNSAGQFSQQVPLYAGKNDVIILATDENTFTNWAGFLRETIDSTGSKSAFTLTLTWEPNNTDVDLHVREPAEPTDYSSIPTRELIPSINTYYYDTKYPYITADDQDGYGPEQYIATENMTLPNYVGHGKSLYGTYKFRVKYKMDTDHNPEYIQPVHWTVNLNYLAFNDSDNGLEYRSEKTWTGTLSTADIHLSQTFGPYHSSPSWSPIYEVEYKRPNPADYGIPPPPQNQLPK